MNAHQTLTQEEKDDLQHLTFTPQKINGRDLIYAFLIILALFCIFVPKIYVSSQIYYLSRDIAKISHQLELLMQENKNLNQELEDFKFQQAMRMDL